jgi:hypothetical protein
MALSPNAYVLSLSATHFQPDANDEPPFASDEFPNTND